ncbi:hypothetical protein ACJX0J_037953, partial [Zea mays]
IWLISALRDNLRMKRKKETLGPSLATINLKENKKKGNILIGGQTDRSLTVWSGIYLPHVRRNAKGLMEAHM